MGRQFKKEGIYIYIYAHMCCAVLSHFSHVQLFATPWTVASQVPLSMRILQARILEWVAVPFSGVSSQPCISISCIAGGFFTMSHWGSPKYWYSLWISKSCIRSESQQNFKNPSRFQMLKWSDIAQKTIMPTMYKVTRENLKISAGNSFIY